MADFNSSLPVRTQANGDVVAGIVKTGNTQIDPATEQKQDSEITQLTAANVSLDNIEADADAIRVAQTDGTQKTKVVDAAGDTLAVNTDGSINVVVQAEGVSSTEKHIYGTTVAGVPNTPSSVVDYTVTVGKTFRIRKFQASGSGKLKVELKVGPAATEVTKATAFTSTATPTTDIELPAPIEVPAGEKILVVVTNKDTANQDLYAFVNGNEV